MGVQTSQVFVAQKRHNAFEGPTLSHFYKTRGSQAPLRAIKDYVGRKENAGH